MNIHYKKKYIFGLNFVGPFFFNTAKRSLQLTLSLISLKLMSKTEWDLCPLKTGTHRFILNTTRLKSKVCSLERLKI